MGSTAYNKLNAKCYSHKISNGVCTSALDVDNSDGSWTPGPCCSSVTGDNKECMKMDGWEKPMSNGQPYCSCAKRSWGSCKAYKPGNSSWF